MANPPTTKRAETEMQVRPVAGRSTVDMVADEIQRAIMTGDLPAGQVFSTAELSSRLNVSHIPVREALQRIETQGLVRLRPGRRAQVAPIDHTEIDDAYRLWILICDDVVGRACERYTEDDLVELAMQLGVFGSLDPSDEKAVESHHAFHLRLLAPGASAWDQRLLNQLGAVIERGVRVAYTTASFHDASPYDEHLPLLTAARNRDTAALQRALRDHQERHKRLVTGALQAIRVA